MTETDASDLELPSEGPARRRGGIRWKAVVGLAGLAGLAIAVVTTADDARGEALPSAGPVVAAVVLHMVALACASWAWASLFPPAVDRRALASGLYTSQLTKYLPAGGFVQMASQVALSSQGDVAAAALRFPVFSLTYVLAGVTIGAGVAVAGDLPPWARALGALGLVLLVTLDRRALAAALRLARRLVKRLPEPDRLPPQGAILRCYAGALANMAVYAAAFVILLRDLTDVEPFAAWAALAAGWAVGYVVVFLPSGIIVREAVLLAALPGLDTATLLGASIAHRLAGLVAEVLMAAWGHLRLAYARRAAATAAPAPDDHAVAGRAEPGQAGGPDGTNTSGDPSRRPLGPVARMPAPNE